MLEKLIFPWSIATANGAGRAMMAAGINLFPLTPKSLKRAAVRHTRLEDFREDEIEEGLNVLCRSVNEESRITFIGRIAMHEHFSHALATRLVRVQIEKDRPELFNTKLIPPIIVIGLPRSGTTFLYKLLCRAPDARAIPTWELRAPLAVPGRKDKRRIRAITNIGRLKKVSPGIDAKHLIHPDEPEEDTTLFDSCFWSGTYWRLTPSYSYLDWYLAHDPAPGYAEYRRFLQLAQAAAPGKRLTLKNPEHTGFVKHLLKAVPEALIVQTHRQPAPIIASYVSLVISMHSATSKPLDLARSGKASLNLWGLSADWNMRDRKDIPSDRIIDVYYDDITADPIGVVKKIYRHFDLPFTQEFEERLKREVDDRPQHKYGVHKYDLATYGLTEDEVNKRFAAYREKFGV